MPVPRPPRPSPAPRQPGAWLTRRRAASIAVAIVAIAALTGVALAVTSGDSGQDAEARIGDRRPATTTTSSTTPTRPSTTTTTAPARPSTTSTTTTTALPTTTTTAPPSPRPPAQAPAPAAAGGALCIGDSVMLGASPSYMGTLTMCGTVDAAVSRQMSEGPAIVRSHAPYPSTVIIHLGTNGTVNSADVDDMMRTLEGVPTVVLTTVQLNGGRSWQDQANAEIRAAAARWPNARLADWETASTSHPEYFATDGIHLSAPGAQAYATTLASAL